MAERTNNSTHLLIGAWRVDVLLPGEEHATAPRAREARLFPLGPVDPTAGPRGTVHLGVGAPGPHGSGPLIELANDDPDWWDQVARAAGETAAALRALREDMAEEARADEAWHAGYPIGGGCE